MSSPLLEPLSVAVINHTDKRTEAGEMAQQLRLFIAFVEDLGFVPRTHMMANKLPLTPVPGIHQSLLEFKDTRIPDTKVHIHTYIWAKTLIKIFKNTS